MRTLMNQALGAQLRILEKDGQPWFVAKDICDALGIQQTSRAVERLDDDEKGVSRIHTLGGPQELIVISESGLYGLILRSDKPGAKVFRKWVTSEVLPEIRKTGGYAGAGGWEAELRRLEDDRAAAMDLLKTADERLDACRREIAQRLQLPMLKAPGGADGVLKIGNQVPNGPSRERIDYGSLVAAMPLPSYTLELVTWMILRDGSSEATARMRLRRMHRRGILQRNADGEWLKPAPKKVFENEDVKQANPDESDENE